MPSRRARRWARWVPVALWSALLVFLAACTQAPDGTPDDRLLARMQTIVSEAQLDVDEMGEAPASIDLLIDRVRAREDGRLKREWDKYEGELAPPSGLKYQRLDLSTLRLCGVFGHASTGQSFAAVYSDFFVGLHEDLSTPRPRAGTHCYEVHLRTTEPSARRDALVFRALNELAMAAECASLEMGTAPPTLDALRSAIGKNVIVDRPPSCNALDLNLLARPGIEYEPVGQRRVRLCGDFERRYDASQNLMDIFDPYRDASFPELAETRTDAGRRCYEVRLLAPDPKSQATIPAWNDSEVGVEHLPVSAQAAARKDKRAIGDVSNVLRLARCAYTIEGSARNTFEEALETIRSRPALADRFGCQWAPNYFAAPQNAPVVSYERVGIADVRVCANFEGSWSNVLALNFYTEALDDWPESLPELQRSVASGRSCYSVSLSRIGDG